MADELKVCPVCSGPMTIRDGVLRCAETDAGIKFTSAADPRGESVGLGYTYARELRQAGDDVGASLVFRIANDLDALREQNKQRDELLREAVAALQYMMEDENMIPRATSTARSHIKPVIDRARAAGIKP